MEETHACPWLLVLSFSIGKFFLLSLTSVLAAILLHLFLLGNLGVDLLSIPHGTVLGEEDGGRVGDQLLPLPGQVGQEGLCPGEGQPLGHISLTFLV
jgi:hypothetical protein